MALDLRLGAANDRGRDLGRDLITTKDDRWLWQRLDQEDNQGIREASDTVSPDVSAQPRGPLYLKDAKKEHDGSRAR